MHLLHRVPFKALSPAFSKRGFQSKSARRGHSWAAATASRQFRGSDHGIRAEDTEKVVLSERVRARLGLPKKDTEPILLTRDQTDVRPSLHIQQNAMPQDDILDLRGSRPGTGELADVDYQALGLNPRSSKVRSAEYIKSSMKCKDWPSATMPEIAVIGRSNVGKSSLINMLTGRKELALVSKTPGKTRAINHFLINKAWYLVDLPGYGYAKQSKEDRFTWGKFTQQFFVERSTLIQVLLLIDATVPIQDLDLSCAQWLLDNGVPFSIVYTKMDKRKKRCLHPSENIANFQEALHQFMPEQPADIKTSASEGKGRDELLRYLAAIRAHVGFA